MNAVVITYDSYELMEMKNVQFFIFFKILFFVLIRRSFNVFMKSLPWQITNYNCFLTDGSDKCSSHDIIFIDFLVS